MIPWETASPRRIYLAVAAAAVVVYLGALANRFAMDDLYIVLYNDLVHHPSGVWRAFAEPYWPAQFGGQMYRPLTVATFAVDWSLGSVWWFHAANLLGHAGASIAVAALARCWAGPAAAVVAGVVFAWHPVHVEAVANVVGRGELLAALFTGLAVYAALVRHSPGWSTAALVAGLLSKENAAVAPGLIVWGWLLGIDRPTRRKAAVFVASWAAIAVAYLAVRTTVLAPYEQYHALAPVFVGAGPGPVRLTAVAALADVSRLLVFPLHLRADYSPAERTLVTSPLDGRLLLGVACLVTWGALLGLAWRRQRRVEAFGLGWIAIAFLPVANLLFPIGVLTAERTLYLPSAGLALAVGALLAPAMRGRRAVLIAGVVLVVAGARTALRAPVWKDDARLALSMLEDSPRSYRGLSHAGALYLVRRQPAKALAAYREAAKVFDRDPQYFYSAADAAFQLGQPQVADSLLAHADRLCHPCLFHYYFQAAAARSRGDSAVAESLLVRARRWERP
ncbi:MAG: hypothetical protein ACREL9_03290 [Gemmatimonadales bacterium]